MAAKTIASMIAFGTDLEMPWLLIRRVYDVDSLFPFYDEGIPLVPLILLLHDFRNMRPEVALVL